MVGFLVAIPIGPVGLLIMQRSIKLGWVRGLMSGIGAALADGVFALAAVAGLSVLLGNVGDSHHWVQLAGSFILLVVGIYYMQGKKESPKTEEVLSSPYLQRYLWDLFSTFFLTLMNPATVMAFAAVFAGTDFARFDTLKNDYVAASLGVFLGSMLWWLVLIFFSQRLRKWLSPQGQIKIQKVVGFVLMALALFSMFPRAEKVINAPSPPSDQVQEQTLQQ